MEVSITPHQLGQGHWFQFSLNQSYLGPFIKRLFTILQVNTSRGNRDYPSKSTPGQ
jgi:hypothetical protein